MIGRTKSILVVLGVISVSKRSDNCKY